MKFLKMVWSDYRATLAAAAAFLAFGVLVWALPKRVDLDPARIGLSAILASEECGRAWAIERMPQGDYRIVELPFPFANEAVPGLERCPTQGPRIVTDSCERDFAMQPTGNGRATLARVADSRNGHALEAARTLGCPP